MEHGTFAKRCGTPFKDVEHPCFSFFFACGALSTSFLDVLEIPWALPGEQQYLKSIAHGGHYVVPSVGLNKPLHFEIQWVANKTNDTCAVAPGWRYGTKSLELLSSLCSTCFGSRRWKKLTNSLELLSRLCSACFGSRRYGTRLCSTCFGFRRYGTKFWNRSVP